MISQRVLSCRAEEGVSPCALTTPAAALPKRGGGGFVRSLGERMCSVPAEAGPRGRRLISGHMRSLGLRRRGKQTRRRTLQAWLRYREGRRALDAERRGITCAGVAPGPQSNLSNPAGEPGERLSELHCLVPTEQATGAYPETGAFYARRLAEGEAPTERTPLGTPAGLDAQRFQGVQGHAPCSPWMRRRGKQTRSVTENSVETLMRASGPLARSYLGIAAVARGPHPDPQTRRGGVM